MLRKTGTFLINLLCITIPLSSSATPDEVIADSLSLDAGLWQNPSMMLRGKISGVRVSSVDANQSTALNVDVRGTGSVRGDSQPLWVVDGVPLTRTSSEIIPALWQEKYGNWRYMTNLSELTGLNPYDIQSFQVLKNTSATAMYGSRGANGVIVVTTKRPSLQKAENLFEWNSNLGLNLSSIGAPFQHNHNLAFSSSKGKFIYRLGAFYRDERGASEAAGSRSAGFRILFDTAPVGVVNFGMSLSLVYQNTNQAWTLAGYGSSLSLDEAASGYRDTQKGFRSSNSVHLDFNFTPYLKWKNTATVDFRDNNRWIWYDTDTGPGKWQNGTEGLSYVSSLDAEYHTSLQFDWNFAVKHHLHADAGAELVFRNDRLNTMNGGDFVTCDLGIESFYLRETADNPCWIKNKRFSYGFNGTLSYTYNNITGVRVSINADRTTDFEKTMTVYPSGDVWLDFSELFGIDRRKVSSIRLEMGYGRSGNSRYVPYRLYSAYTSGEFYQATDQTAAFFEGWQKVRVRECNAGISLAACKDRLKFSALYFVRNNDDGLELFRRGVPGTDGVWVETERTVENSSSAGWRTNGVEADISASIIKTENIDWNADLNFTWNRSEVTYASERAGCNINSDGLYANAFVPGYPVGSLWGNILAEDGSLAGQGILGCAVPQIHGGFGTALRLWDFTLDLRFDGAAGFDIVNLGRMLSDSQTMISNRYVEKGDYLRLSRASLIYDIPLKGVKWIRSLKVSASTGNLFTVTSYSGLAPDVNSFGANNASLGLDYCNLPSYRTIMFGIAAKF